MAASKTRGPNFLGVLLIRALHGFGSILWPRICGISHVGFCFYLHLGLATWRLG